MARIHRPYIPLRVRCRVALGQLGEMWPEDALQAASGHLKPYLGVLLDRLADLLGCTPADLRLDHDPPLAARPVSSKGYVPDANDPDHLRYRPHGAQFAGSHDIKTRVRGDHGQYSDLALIKRERKRNRKDRPKPKHRWPKRPFPKRKK